MDNFLISVSLFLSQPATMGLSIFAQNNASSQNGRSMPSVQNQTAATLTGQPVTAIVNKQQFQQNKPQLQ